MHEKMPLIFKWSTTSGWFLWSIWTSSQCEHWIAACDAFTLSTKVTFDHISIMAEFGPPVWRLTIRLITELYVQIAKASYYKSLVWTVTVNKQRHGAGTKAWCFTLFRVSSLNWKACWFDPDFQNWAVSFYLKQH